MINVIESGTVENRSITHPFVNIASMSVNENYSFI